MKRDTIKNHADFVAGENDPTARCAYFLIRAKAAKYPDNPKYGLIVTKKTFKHAVDRNRAKRLIRDWIAHNEKTARNGRLFTKEEGDIVIQYRSQTNTNAGNNPHRFLLKTDYHRCGEK